MKAKRFSFGRVAIVVLASLFVFGFTGCSWLSNLFGDDVTGTYTSSYGDSYVITSSTITYNDGGYGYDWEGDVVATDKDSDTASGYLYVKYTSVGTELDRSLVGNYTAVHYKDLSDTGALLSNASKYGYDSYKSDLSEAKSEFTVDNGYFSYYGEYARSN